MPRNSLSVVEALLVHDAHIRDHARARHFQAHRHRRAARRDRCPGRATSAAKSAPAQNRPGHSRRHRRRRARRAVIVGAGRALAAALQIGQARCALPAHRAAAWPPCGLTPWHAARRAGRRGGATASRRRRGPARSRAGVTRSTSMAFSGGGCDQRDGQRPGQPQRQAQAHAAAASRSGPPGSPARPYGLRAIMALRILSGASRAWRSPRLAKPRRGPAIW